MRALVEQLSEAVETFAVTPEENDAVEAAAHEVFECYKELYEALLEEEGYELQGEDVDSILEEVDELIAAGALVELSGAPGSPAKKAKKASGGFRRAAFKAARAVGHAVGFARKVKRKIRQFKRSVKTGFKSGVRRGQWGKKKPIFKKKTTSKKKTASPPKAAAPRPKAAKRRSRRPGGRFVAGRKPGYLLKK